MTSLFKSKDKAKVAATPDKKDKDKDKDKDKKASNNNNNNNNEEEDTQAEESSSPGRYMKNLKEYAIIMEYKKLKQLAPEGVYVMPSIDSIRRWHGVIFLRHSLYRKGVFKFIINIPESYPNDAPKVFFTSKVFNPLVNIKTGTRSVNTVSRLEPESALYRSRIGIFKENILQDRVLGGATESSCF